MRNIVKGVDGHTADRLRDEIILAFRELAVVFLIDQYQNSSATVADDLTSPADRVADLKRDGALQDAEVVELSSKALSRVLAITTDGGANMHKAAALVMQSHRPRHGDALEDLSIRRARLCVCHTLQLLVRHSCLFATLVCASLTLLPQLKHLCNGDATLSSALAGTQRACAAATLQVMTSSLMTSSLQFAISLRTRRASASTASRLSDLFQRRCLRAGRRSLQVCLIWGGVTKVSCCR